MVAEPTVLAASAAAIGAVLVIAVEMQHFARVVKLAPLAFGPRQGMLTVAVIAPILRVLAVAAVAWGLTILATTEPLTHRANDIRDNEYRHLVLVLDVSPSMQLEDAGPSGKQKRAERAADLIQSFFERVQAEKYKTTIVAVYTEAKPVVKDTTDREVVRNILTELPMRHAFKSGETNMFAGLTMAAEIAKPWPPGTAVLMVVTDGDTVPATGMPKMPASIGNNVVMVGVGNPAVGKSISGHMSRQDTSTLRQVATRLSGTYHDGNDKQLTTELVSRIDEKATPHRKEETTNRDYALWAIAIGSAVMVFVPVVLSLIGTGWHPGRHPWQTRTGFGVPRRTV